ncbi:hypothetical protein NDU88_006486 [Pleurodeles waltl]|uniref:Unhealthy ribosome biogenesis protein 2 homolog n=1 Tax=Pleurodeles waltl TaxID=8319 RepID=A0AAV7RP56_PLEWA|nr:hypothetical protein NDU88_006486 [Pleurodeles waltl]
MAALYSGIHLKLKSPRTSWQDKLKIAHFAWISEQCFVPNKEQVLLDWVSHALTGNNSKKLDLDDGVVEKLWAYFDSIVNSRKLKQLLKEGKTINLRFAIAQVINDRISSFFTLKAENTIYTVLSCCKAILSNPALTVVYTAKCELMVELLSRLCHVACQQLISVHPLIPQVFDVLNLTFSQYLLIQRQQVNVHRVFGHMIEHLLQHCLLLRHLLSSRTWVRDEDSKIRHQLSKDIRNKLEAVLLSGLFQAELVSFYKEELLLGKEQVDKRGSIKNIFAPVHTLLNKLFDFNDCEECICTDVVANSVPLLYKLFLNSYCKEGNQLICFYMVARLFDCVQITHQVETGGRLPLLNWNLSLHAAEQLLNYVLDHDIYNIAVDRIQHEETQFKFYRKLAEILVNNSQPSVPAWFRCLRALVLLNHLIVEPDLDDIISSAWIDANITEIRVRKAQEVLITTLFQTYTKLRQFPKLFEEVLDVICRPAAEDLREPILWYSLPLMVSECLLELPPNQLLDIWESVLLKCSTLILPDIKDDSDMSLKLLSMSSILHFILFNMKSLDNTTPVPVIHRTWKLMEKILKDLIRPLLNLHQGYFAKEIPPLWLEKASDSALLLSHTWVEVNTVLTLNCSKYDSAVGDWAIPAIIPMKSWDFTILIPDVHCWKNVVKNSCQVNSMSKYCLELLSLQKMKKILMQFDISSETSCQSLQNAASFIFHSGTICLMDGQHDSWSCSASSVNPRNYPVAHWHLIISHLSVLVPYIPTDVLHSVADVLLQTWLSAEVANNLESPNLCATIENVSVNLLHSSDWLEICGLRCAILTCLIRECAQIICNNKEDVLCDVLIQLSMNIEHWKNGSSFSKLTLDVDLDCEERPLKNVLSVSWETMKSVSESILLSSKKGSSIFLDEDQLTHLDSLLNIIYKLKPDSFMPVDLVRCFLLLLSLAARVRGTSSCTKTKTLQFHKKNFHLLTLLQSANYAVYLFKTVHASDFLKMVMDSLFAASNDFCAWEQSHDWFDLLLTTQMYFEHFFQNILNRKQSLLINVEKCSYFLANCRPYLETTSKKKSKQWSQQAGQLLIVALGSMCRVTVPYLQKQVDESTSETVATLLQGTIHQMGTVIHITLHETISQPLVPPFFVKCVTTLLETELSLVSYWSTTVRKSSNKNFDVCQHKVELQHTELYRVFYSQTVNVLQSIEEHFQFVKAALQFFTFYCSVPEEQQEKERTVTCIFSTLQKLLAGHWITIPIIQSLEPDLIGLLGQLLNTCAREEFCTMMKLVLHKIDVKNLWKKSVKEVLSAVTIVKLMISCQLSRDSEMRFWSTVPQIMTGLGLLTMEACHNQSLISVLTVPILDLVAYMLMKGEGILQSPHHVTLAFNILLSVSFDRLHQDDYYNVFHGSHKVLFSILQYHTKVMLRAVASFLNCFNRLVTSVMHEGRQGEKGMAPLSLCAIVDYCRKEKFKWSLI